MNLNDLLRIKGIDPKKVLVLRHRPQQPKLNKALPWLAAEKPDVFNAYQQTQRPKVEKAMTRAGYVASFIGREPGKALFVGLYVNEGWKPLTSRQFGRIPATGELLSLGMEGFTADSPRSSILWFDLVLSDFYAEWKGKLVVGWPGLELAWHRWADKPRNEMPVLAVLEESVLDAEMPEWHFLNLAWEELAVLPSRWKSALAQWRGVYFIFDASDGKGYVGSAYGETNILGRWMGYAARGHGGNRLLRQRDPQNFQFTILQRVSPYMDAAEVIRLEATWKERLHTRKPYGLNDN